MMKRDLAISLIVSLLIALFSYTALSKALDYKSFVTIFLIEAVVDAKGAAVMGILVPLLEAMTVLLLLFYEWGLAAFILETRLQLGKFLLLHTDMPVKEIALTTGYKHSENFGTAFRKFFGMTPSALRNNLT